MILQEILSLISGFKCVHNMSYTIATQDNYFFPSVYFEAYCKIPAWSNKSMLQSFLPQNSSSC